MERQVTQEQVIDAAVQGLRNSMYFRVPGAVTAYHTDSMTADIQPMTNDPRTNIDTGGVVTEAWPVIKNVPIAWPRFGSLVLVGPLKVGDPVVLEAFDVDPTTAFTAGAQSSSTPVDPGDVRRHGGGYWSAMPTNLTKAITDASAAAAAYILGIDGDPAQLIMSAAALILGKTGATVSLAGGAHPLVVAPWAIALASALSTFASTVAGATPPVDLATTLTFLGSLITAFQTLNGAMGSLPPDATTATTAT